MCVFNIHCFSVCVAKVLSTPAYVGQLRAKTFQDRMRTKVSSLLSDAIHTNVHCVESDCAYLIQFSYYKR